jgi:hypothetical protein
MDGTETRLRDGNVYSWRWLLDDKRHADNAPYRSYHCRSQIAEVWNGALYDTFWTGHSYEHRLSEADVILTFRGNINEMTPISEWQLHYYRPDDIVDMRHSNNSGAPIWLKPGAVRDAERMREWAEYERQNALSAIQSAEHKLSRFNDALALIEKGALADVNF